MEVYWTFNNNNNNNNKNSIVCQNIYAYLLMMALKLYKDILMLIHLLRSMISDVKTCRAWDPYPRDSAELEKNITSVHERGES